MKRFIDASIWLCGEGYEHSKLYRSSDGKQCCLGQWAAMAGIPIEKMRNHASPQCLLNRNLVEPSTAAEYFSTFTVRDSEPLDPTYPFISTDYAVELMYTNDRKRNGSDEPMTLRQRIAAMGQIGEKYGDEIIFLNVPEDQLSW